MMFGVEDKPRFSLKRSDGTIESFGTCDVNDHDRTYLISIDGRYFLAHVGKYGIGETEELNPGDFLCNGYYEHERDEWVTPEEFYKNGSNKI